MAPKKAARAKSARARAGTAPAQPVSISAGGARKAERQKQGVGKRSASKSPNARGKSGKQRGGAGGAGGSGGGEAEKRARRVAPDAEELALESFIFGGDRGVVPDVDEATLGEGDAERAAGAAPAAEPAGAVEDEEPAAWVDDDDAEVRINIADVNR
jgi:hypothetical protein